jgi:hypothetical protein
MSALLPKADMCALWSRGEVTNRATLPMGFFLGEEAMKLPTRMLDLSSPLDNDTVFDPPFMRPKIEYRTNAENAPMLLNNFPGLRQEDLPDGEVGRSKSCN